MREGLHVLPDPVHALLRVRDAARHFAVAVFGRRSGGSQHAVPVQQLVPALLKNFAVEHEVERANAIEVQEGNG